MFASASWTFRKNSTTYNMEEVGLHGKDITIIRNSLLESAREAEDKEHVTLNPWTYI